jgi:Uncharacterized protein conserved in bacteria
MKDILQKYAKYNIAANLNMNSIIESSKPDIRILNSNGYYKNIEEILIHILDVDISWLSILKIYFPNSALRNDTIREMTEDESIQMFSDRAVYRETRTTVDLLLKQLCDELSDDDWEKRIEYVGKGNKDTKRKVWEIIIHIFNHQTHHRGQISQILDEHGIENDYSNIIRII